MANSNDPRYFPKQFRGKRRTHLPAHDTEPGRSLPPKQHTVHWTVMLLTWLALFIAVFAIIKAIR